jgi:hypothetical protein
MPRRKPRTGWKPEYRAIELTEKQKARLQLCKLPQIAVRAVEGLAERAISGASVDYPNNAEVRAALKKLRGKISASRAAIAGCDEWTAKHIDLAYYRLLKGEGKMARLPRPQADIMRPADDRLCALERAIDAADTMVKNRVTRRTSTALYLASQLKVIFDSFGIRFDPSDKSPAKEILRVILGFITPKIGVDAAAHYIRELENSCSE